MQKSGSLDNLDEIVPPPSAHKSVGGHLAHMFQDATAEKMLMRDTFSSFKNTKKDAEFLAFFNERDHMGRLIRVIEVNWVSNWLRIQVRSDLEVLQRETLTHQ